jgi:hypothetical protein
MTFTDVVQRGLIERGWREEEGEWVFQNAGQRFSLNSAVVYLLEDEETEKKARAEHARLGAFIETLDTDPTRFPGRPMAAPERRS